MLHTLPHQQPPLLIPVLLLTLRALPGQPKRYVYLDHVQHPSLRSLRVPVFFKLCRLEGISFDLGTQVSSATLLIGYNDVPLLLV